MYVPDEGVDHWEIARILQEFGGGGEAGGLPFECVADVEPVHPREGGLQVFAVPTDGVQQARVAEGGEGPLRDALLSKDALHAIGSGTNRLARGPANCPRRTQLLVQGAAVTHHAAPRPGRDQVRDEQGLQGRHEAARGEEGGRGRGVAQHPLLHDREDRRASVAGGLVQ